MARGEGGGRPKKEIDEKLVRKLAAIQCTMEEIAAICDCSVDTLERRFADIIKAGKAQGKTSLRRHLWKMVENGNTSVAIWLSKQHLGMTDKLEQAQEMNIKAELTVPAMTKDQAKELLEKLAKKSA